jgi:hypothetical protein
MTMKQTILFTDEDGRARFRERLESLEGGSPAVRLSDLYSSGGFQFRESPVGYESAFHCTEQPQWIVVLKGCMEIVLQDGSTRQFKQGEYFFCADVLPAASIFDPTIHGHRSRQCGEEVLQTMFISA